MKKLIFSLSAAAVLSTGAPGAVLINEIDLANNKVELFNAGTMAVDFSGWFWCNRVNGSPRYDTVTSASTIDSALSSTGASLTNFGTGQVLVLSITSTFLPDASGELGLYTTNDYTNSNAIEDYAAWGGSGIRDSVADAAGLWPDGDFIDVSSIGSGESLQANPGTEGIGSEEWTIGEETLGSANIPEPTASFLGLFGFALIFRRRQR